jgi:threonyl-tRNA synthetase
MAQATRMVMGPTAKLAIGPDVDNGWYYDIDFGDATLEESKLKEIEKKMRSIVREGQEFRQFSLSVADAKTLLSSLGEIYKLEMVDDLAARGETTISFFANIGKFHNPTYASFEFLNNPDTIAINTEGEISVGSTAVSTDYDFRTSTFIDMCQGPHVQFTNSIPEDSFKVDKLAGAYWRGDSKNKQLTRIYGLAFETGADLTAYETMMEEAKKRDHRILGKKTQALHRLRPRRIGTSPHPAQWYDHPWSDQGLSLGSP